MTAVALAPWEVADFDPLKDKSYADADLGPDVAAFLAWLELGGAAPITVDNYERALAVTCRMYPHTAIQDLTDVQLGQVFKTFPPKGRRTRVAPYRTFFKWARQTRRIQENPMDLLPVMRKQPKKVHDVFSDAEIDQLLGLDIVDAAPLALLFEAGLRRAEACRLQLRNCAPEGGNVRVIEGKGGKDRLVPESPRLKTLLLELVTFEGLNPDDHLFYGVRANYKGMGVHKRRVRSAPIAFGTFSRWWQRCLDEAGVRYRNPHEARHTFATRWKRRGLPAEDLAIVMGHESVTTTINQYFHIEADEVGGRMAAIEAEEALRG